MTYLKKGKLCSDSFQRRFLSLKTDSPICFSRRSNTTSVTALDFLIRKPCTPATVIMELRSGTSEGIKFIFQDPLSVCAHHALTRWQLMQKRFDSTLIHLSVTNLRPTDEILLTLTSLKNIVAVNNFHAQKLNLSHVKSFHCVG